VKKKHKECHTSRDWLWTLDWGESNLQRVDLRSLLGICSDGWRWSMSPRSLGWGDSTQICFLCFFHKIWLVVTGTWLDYDFPIILGISSSQLTFTPSFFRGVGLNHQPVMLFWSEPLYYIAEEFDCLLVNKQDYVKSRVVTCSSINQFVLNSFGFLHLCIFYIRLSFIQKLYNQPWFSILFSDCHDWIFRIWVSLNTVIHSVFPQMVILNTLW